jgi:hypothetical protein
MNAATARETEITERFATLTMPVFLTITVNNVMKAVLPSAQLRSLCTAARETLHLLEAWADANV